LLLAINYQLVAGLYKRTRRNNTILPCQGLKVRFTTSNSKSIIGPTIHLSTFASMQTNEGIRQTFGWDLDNAAFNKGE